MLQKWDFKFQALLPDLICPFQFKTIFSVFTYRIKTNGSLPRDKRGQFAPPSPSYSSTPPQSPLDILHNELLKQSSHNHHNYENVNITYASPQTYENVEVNPREFVNGEYRSMECNSPYENVYLQQMPNDIRIRAPPSPRTQIKTFVNSNKDW